MKQSVLSLKYTELPKVSPSMGQPPSGNSQCKSSSNANSAESFHIAHFQRSLIDKGFSSKLRSSCHLSGGRAPIKTMTLHGESGSSGASTNMSPISSSLDDIVSFITDQFHAGHSYHSLKFNVYRSAIPSSEDRWVHD